jgi:hypothetical protein
VNVTGMSSWHVARLIRGEDEQATECWRIVGLPDVLNVTCPASGSR